MYTTQNEINKYVQYDPIGVLYIYMNMGFKHEFSKKEKKEEN